MGQKAMDVHRMAHHAQVPEARALNAQKRGDIQIRWTGGCVRPPCKKFTAPTGQASMFRLLNQKSLQGLAALQSMPCA
jgi:hypothetical protein